MSKMEDTLTQFMHVSISNQKSIDASIKNLVVQVGQLAKEVDPSQQPHRSNQRNIVI